MVAALCSASASTFDHSRPAIKFACPRRVGLTQFGESAQLSCAVVMHISSNSSKAMYFQSVCYKLRSQVRTPQTITWLLSQH